MDVPITAAPVIAALIALCGVILTPFIHHQLTLRREDAKSSPLSAARREALQGRWTGIAIQQAKEGLITSKIQLDLVTKSRKVSGNGEIRHRGKRGKEIKEEFTLLGFFFADKFARFTFDDKDPAKIQPGSMMLVLADDSKKMRGIYIGYGSESRDLGSGTIELIKGHDSA